MKIRVRTFARYSELFGREHALEVDDGTTIHAALEVLCGGEDEKREALFNEQGSVYGYIILLKNRARVERDDLHTLALQDGDEVAILPPVAGG